MLITNVYWYLYFMKFNKIKPKFKKYSLPKIGLIALASDYMIERDFQCIKIKILICLLIELSVLIHWQEKSC